MRYLIRKSFIEDVPTNKREHVLKKLEYFTSQLNENKKDITNITPGTLARKIKSIGNKNLYKFRINRGDRVIFGYYYDLHKEHREGYNNCIVFLAYRNHDEQIRTAERSQYNNIVFEEYDESNDLLDISINNEFSEWSEEQFQDNIFYDVQDSRNDAYISSLIESGSEDYWYYLNDDQAKCLNIKLPLFVSGSAGSGKTTLGLHWLIQLCKKDCDGTKRVAYFTYTNGLRDHIKKLFDKFAPKELPNKPYFYTFSEYCLKVLSVSESQVINFKKFEKKWRYLLKSIQFDPIDIWAEIRGIIKGYMGINGFRKEEFDKDLIEQKTFDILYKNKLIEGLSNKDSGRFYRCLCLNEMADDRIILEHFPEKEIADAVRILRDLLRTFTYSSDRILKRSKYIDIIEGYSIFNKSERTEIYNFVDKHYKNWLKEENYDENDLALKVIEKTQKNELEKFDALICDEIQDLSELQIFMLRNLTKDKMSVFFAGDVHQTINPTYFDPGRLSNLFYNHNKKKSELTRQFLAKNYRSQEKIVDLASTLAEFRQRTIGKYGDEDDYREVAIRKGTIPKILSFNNDNYKRLFEAAEQRAYVTVVVADEDDKINLKKEFNKANIFTIQEMKGLESQYIVVYNMISKNISAWADIIKNNPEVKRNTKYRYYFNLFYVAITRAIEHLCFLEKDKESEVFFNYADFKKHFETVNIFDSEKLCLTEQSNRKDWKDQGKYYEKKELYKDAIRCYRNAYDEQGEKRCKAKELASEGNYLQAGEILVEIKEFKLALDYFNKSRNYFRQLEVILHYDYLKDYKEIDEYFNGKTNKDVLNIFLESDGKCWNIFNKVYLQPKLGKYKRLVENVVIQLSKL